MLQSARAFFSTAAVPARRALRWALSLGTPDRRDSRGEGGSEETARTNTALQAEIAVREQSEARLREAIEKVRQGEERLRLALDAGFMGAWDWDIRTNRLRTTARRQGPEARGRPRDARRRRGPAPSPL
jgi:PAS domain-containing protein